MSLTKRQKKILDYIKDFLCLHGYSPTLKEIATHFNLASLNGVYKHLQALEERGFIRRLSNQSRSIKILETPSPQEISLPLLGYIAAGRPVEPITHVEEISVPDTFLSQKTNYVLRVVGDSMVGEHIQDGDYVIVQQTEEAHNGETIIALINEERATLKKFYRERNKIRLQPANPDFSPLYVDETQLKIQGIVIGIIRRY